MRTRAFAALATALFAASAAAASAGCGSETLPETPPAVSPSDRDAASAPDTSTAPDAAAPPDAATPRDASASDVAPPDAADAAPADAAPADAAPDAPAVDAAPPDAGAVVASVKITTLFMNCMPVVPKDPISVTGSVEVTNSTPGTIGPVAGSRGEIRSAAGALLTTFDLTTALSIGPLTAGQTASANFTKRPTSAVPAAQCATLTCNSDVTVSVPLTGTGLPPTTARSAPVRVSCAF